MARSVSVAPILCTCTHQIDGGPSRSPHDRACGQDRLGSGEEATFERVGIEPGKHPDERVVGGNAMGQIEEGRQPFLRRHPLPSNSALLTTAHTAIVMTSSN
jgi:hypothetical protein